jgi:hypothetical protein
MLIERERYLDDSGRWHISLALQSRTLPMHSLLSALTVDERAAVSNVLAHALDEVADLLRQKLAAARQEGHRV